MGELRVQIEPKQVGFSADRLGRIDEHFRDYVNDGRLPGYSIAVARGGHLAHVSIYGQRDVEAQLPTTLDTMYRIYSMTKPVTSVALLMLVEEGKLQLTDLVSEYIPSFAETRVWRGGTVLKPITDPVTEPMRIWHLLTHTAGMTYGFLYADVVDDIYRRAGFDMGVGQIQTLAETCDRYAALPLLFQPGTSWNYSIATDVLGRVIEIVSGMSLDEFFSKKILGPLGMHDTSFYASADKHDRLAVLYGVNDSTGGIKRLETIGNGAKSMPIYLSGGGGLVSTAFDYFLFLQMLANRGVLGDVRLLSPASITLMTMNHLPNNQDVCTFGRALGEEIHFDGVGFGLGFSVVIDQAMTRSLCPVGTYGWGGAASTVFWVDPVEEVTAMFFTQLMPSTTYPIRPYLRQLVYQAITD
jgi:CubicO group peptidase (beta-lactamase class C family)